MTFDFRLPALGLALAVAPAIAAAQQDPARGPQASHRIVVQSPTLRDGEPMPRQYTPDGRNLSPPITWSNLPAGTRQLVVLCEDFGAGNPPPWVHWIIYNIPATATGLPEGVPIDPSNPETPMPAEITGAVQGLNGWKLAMYRGPAPPAGEPHLYNFVVYALDAELNLRPNLTRQLVLEAIEGHVIGRGEIVPIYGRKPVVPAN
jgi:Raf kinase inhibitor-like YbhB/YbcL family protein